MEIALVIWFLFGVVSAVVMSNKGRSGCGGFALGFLLGPIGLIIALVLKADNSEIERNEISSGLNRKCPFCAEIIKIEAKKCRHCGSTIEKPLDDEIRRQLIFSETELSFYGLEQILTLEKVLSQNDKSVEIEVCNAICRRIGRSPFEGPPREFISSYYDQLKTYFESKMI